MLRSLYSLAMTVNIDVIANEVKQSLYLVTNSKNESSLHLKIRSIFLWLIFIIVAGCNSDRASINNFGVFDADTNLVENILKKYPEFFSEVLTNQNEYEVQIIYIQINRDKNNTPSFKQYTYHLDPKNYFYSASLVKLPCSALALEKLNELNVKGLDKFSRMQTDSAWQCQKIIKEDTTAENKIPTIANYIKRMLLVSDNDAYSRTYEFLGQEYINKKLSEKSYPSIRIVHRFDADCFGSANSYTNPVSFYDANDKLVYQQPMQHNIIKYDNPIGIVKKGVGYVDGKGNYFYQPKDMTYYNYMCLQDVNDILRSIIFPYSVPEKQKFNLTKEDYRFLYKYMSMYPCESDYPKYDSKEYKDSYKKYFIYGTCKNKIAEDSIRIFNIVGQSYGYLSDCAYICDFKNKVEFMLSAVIYVNKDGIINDGKYDYDNIGFPFLSNLGQVIYNYERNRTKEFMPDLSDFKFEY